MTPLAKIRPGKTCVDRRVVVELHEARERRLAQNRRIRFWTFVALFAAMGAAWMWVEIRPAPKQQTVEVRP